MTIDPTVCERARRARDARFDGRFFVGVTSTGIYCRPICPAPTAKAANVRYFASAAAAAAAGLRPCLRCRPEAAPGTPAWEGSAATVARGLRLIDDGALDERGVPSLAARLGVGDRHLRRLFDLHLGASPAAIAATRRVQLAKRLIDETPLSLTQVASAAGFRSVRRFNAAMAAAYGCAPSALRRTAPRVRDRLELRLPFRPPYDWGGVLAFLRARAIPGVEQVGADVYRRTFAIDEVVGSVEVELDRDRTALRARIATADPSILAALVRRLRRLFDLAADPDAIARALGTDPFLAERLALQPGVRVPGAFDGFEIAVRAILGQQVSVRAATTLAGRLVERHGARMPDGVGRLFPTAAALVDVDFATLGMPGARARALAGLVRAVVDGAVDLRGQGPIEQAIEALEAVPGIGSWTAQYIAMRAFGEPDAFPDGDLALRRALGVTPRELAARAETWRPWRAYAALLTWQSMASGGVKAAETV